MKKLFLSFAFMAILFANVNAQRKSYFLKNYFGYKTGVTVANLKFSQKSASNSASSKIGFYAGEYAQIGLSDKLALQPEVFYSLLGSQASGDKIHLGYLSVPVLVKYINHDFYILLGPQVSFSMLSTKKYNGLTFGGPSVKTPEVSGVFAMGFALQGGFSLEARHQFGLSNISKQNATSIKVTNNAILIGVCYTPFDYSKVRIRVI